MPHHASNRMMAPRPRQPCEILSGMNLLNGYFKDQPSAGSRPQRRYQVAPIWPGSRILGKAFPPVLFRHDNRGLSRTAFAKRFITNTARVATEIPGRRSLPKKNGATPEERESRRQVTSQEKLLPLRHRRWCSLRNDP